MGSGHWKRSSHMCAGADSVKAVPPCGMYKASPQQDCFQVSGLRGGGPRTQDSMSIDTSDYAAAIVHTGAMCTS
eukprot:12339-Eustigmatos_ZCMA.PRE.1